MSTFSVKDLEGYIQKLIRKFKDEPDFFYSESDMYCYLYCLLYENPTPEIKEDERFYLGESDAT